MATRFRKSIKIMPGVKLNLGKKGASVSVGVKGARVSFNTNGKQTTSVGIPGTGIYETKTTRFADVPKEAPKKKKKKGLFKRIFSK